MKGWGGRAVKIWSDDGRRDLPHSYFVSRLKPHNVLNLKGFKDFLKSSRYANLLTLPRRVNYLMPKSTKGLSSLDR